MVARTGRICKKCKGGGLGEGMGKCDGVWVYGATLAPPPLPPPPQSDKKKGIRKVDIRLPGKGNSNSHGARPVYKNRLENGFGPVGRNNEPILSRARSLSLYLSSSLARSLLLTLSLALSCSLSLTLSLARSLSRSLSLTLAPSLAHSMCRVQWGQDSASAFQRRSAILKQG